jgi:signal transduction histidine kinase
MFNFYQQITSTLRGKLSLWYVLTVGIIILVLLFASSLLLWITVKNQIDHHIHIVVNEAAQIVQNYRGEQREELLKNLVSARGMTIVLLSPDGSAILETNSPDLALVTEHELQGIMSITSLYETNPIHFTQRDLRFAALPVQISAGKGILAVGYSTQVLSATLSTMINIVISIVLFLVIPLTFIGHQLLKKQLQPLEEIAHQAQIVSDTSSLSNRIQTSTNSRELTSITKAINNMLSRLESIFESERTFFSDAAHTLKTPLAVLRSQIENSNFTKASKKKMIQTIDNTAQTIQDLLLLAKIGSKNQVKKGFSLSKLLGDLAELTAILGEEKNIRITTDIQKDFYLEGNKKLLSRAFSNLLHNAVIYNKEKGKIYISLEQDQNQFIIKIYDTGYGISKSDQKKLFMRFFRGDNLVTKSVAGTGLGLAIAQAIIKDHGGQISIDSIKNRKTNVVVKLPK